jgi:tetratricopeptide (TPR) repeat protein
MVLLRRFLLPAAFLLAGSSPVPGAEHGQLDGSPTLFTVFAAINVGGYDADLASAANHPLREQVRKVIQARKPAVLDDLRYLYRKYKQKDPAADLSQYVSLALSMGGPPDFKFKFRTVDLPPDVAVIQEWQPLLVKFYAQAGIQEIWQKVQPAYDEVIARYHDPVAAAVLDANVYLRVPTSGGYLGRRFQIYVDLLGAPNQIHTRLYADDFYVVVTPSPEPHTADVRRAYLQYLIDPLAMKYSEPLLKKKALLDFAKAAPVLPEAYKSDFVLLAIKSMVLAVEARLDRRQAQALVQQALSEGYILTPYFFEQLIAYEKQDQAIRLYFKGMIEGIDLKREDTRLVGVEFASAPQMRKAKLVPQPPPPEVPAARKTLDEADVLYRERKLEEARAAFARCLQQSEERPLHAEAYYGLARIAVLRKDPELAEKLFQKALELEPAAQVKAWVLVYLGRLAGASSEPEAAAKYYREALVVEGASAAAKSAAEQGLQQHSQK